MATHSNILAWRIPRTDETGGLQSTGWQRVRHDWGDLACMHGLTQTQSRSATNWRSRFKEAIKIESSCQYLLHWSSFLNKGPQKKSLPGEILRRSQERSAGWGVHPTLGNWTVGGFPQKKLHVYLITEPTVGLLPQSRHRSLIPWHYKAWEYSFHLFINTLFILVPSWRGLGLQAETGSERKRPRPGWHWLG